MPKYHVMPQTGEVVTCRGRKHCPVLPIESHATDKAEAVELHEVEMARFRAEAAHYESRVSVDPRVKTQVPAVEVAKTTDGVTYVPNYHEYRAAARERDLEEMVLKNFPRPKFTLSRLFSKEERATQELLSRFWLRYDNATEFTEHPYTRAVAWLEDVVYTTEDKTYSTVDQWDFFFGVLFLPYLVFGKNRVMVKAATPEQVSALNWAQALIPAPAFREPGCKC